MRLISNIITYFEENYPTLTEFLKFSIVGTAALFVDLATVHIAYRYLEFSFLISRATGFIVAFTFTFILNRKITFKKKIQTHILRQYILYAAVAVTAFICNCSISVYLYKSILFFHDYYLLAASMGSISGLLINFCGSKFIVFRSF